MDEPGNKRDKLAREVLILSRNTLLVNLRFLDMALSRLSYEPCERSTLMTDGERLMHRTEGFCDSEPRNQHTGFRQRVSGM